MVVPVNISTPPRIARVRAIRLHENTGNETTLRKSHRLQHPFPWDRVPVVGQQVSQIHIARDFLVRETPVSCCFLNSELLRTDVLDLSVSLPGDDALSRTAIQKNCCL